MAAWKDDIDYSPMTQAEKTVWKNKKEVCQIVRHAAFSLKTEPNNEHRTINDLLDAFPYDKAAIYLTPENKIKLLPLLRELNFEVGTRILINRIDSRVDLVIVHRHAPEPSFLRPVVVVSINGTDHESQFPTPNTTSNGGGYTQKIQRFLSSKKRRVMICQHASALS